MISQDALRDHIHCLPPLIVDGQRIVLEVEIHGAWVDNSHEPRSARTPAVLVAIRRLRELVAKATEQQKEE